MNIELYIQSGVVESYALGLASRKEVAEFEQLLPYYPELKEALSEFEYHLELFAIDNEVPPPPDLREKIAARLREMPVVRPVRGKGKSQQREQSAEYIRVEAAPSDQIKVHKYWRTAFIAIFILSKILLVFSIYYFLEYRNAQKRITELEHRAGEPK